MINESVSVQYVSNACIYNSPLSAETDISLPLILFYMNIMKVGAAGIVDKHNHCIGFVTYDDVINQAHDDDPAQQSIDVSDIMRPPTMIVYLDDPAEQALIMMNLHKVDWLPVVNIDTQEFAGLFYRGDIETLPTNIMPLLRGNFLN